LTPCIGAKIMDDQLLAFLNGSVNAVKQGELILSREIVGSSHIIKVSLATDDTTIPMYEFWHNPKKIKASQQPKHTGGKKPYIMVMVAEVEKLRGKGIKNTEELVGFLVCLGQYIQWHTGKLIHKRSKKPVQYKDLQGIFGYGNKKLNRILGDLKKHDLLYSTREGYFISSSLIKKGAKGRQYNV